MGYPLLNILLNLDHIIKEIKKNLYEKDSWATIIYHGQTEWFTIVHGLLPIQMWSIWVLSYLNRVLFEFRPSMSRKSSFKRVQSFDTYLT